MESLKWCGIKIDEGINEGGEFGPYKQSERKDIYFQYAQDLIKSGNAYYAFDTPEELEKIRKEYESTKKTFTYDSFVRKTLKNSISLPENEVKKLIDSGVNYVIRFKIPENQELILNDIIRGEIKVNTSTLDDKVLFKSDGMPTYHLANIVDDFLMKISHVIRGEEWLPSLPLHVLLYKAFGWEEKMPEFAHLPLLLKPDGNGKLSKRDGDKLGFPVFPLQWKSPSGEVSSGYRESDYFPEAFINMLVLLGWNPGTEQEIFSLEQLSESFSLERVGKSGSKFDPEKAKWFNHQYLINKSDKELAEMFQPVLIEKHLNFDLNYIEKVCSLIKDRATFINELWEHSYFFFESPKEYDNKVVKKRWKENSPEILNKIIDILNNIKDFNRKNCHSEVISYLEKNEIGLGAALNALRLTLVGSGKGPDLFSIIELLGKEEVVLRINFAIKTLN